MQRSNLILLVLLAATLSLTACGSTYKPPEGYVPFHSEALKLTVYHPEDWSAEYEAEAERITLHNAESMARISVFVTTTYPANTTSADALANGIANLAQATGGTFGNVATFQTAAGKAAVVQGQAGISLGTVDDQALPDLYLYILAFAASDRVIFMNASTGGEAVFEDVKPIFEEIFRSLQLD